MISGTRTTRVAALMVANGFVLVKAYDRLMTVRPEYSLSILLIVFLPIVGMFAGYVELCRPAPKSGIGRMELASLCCLFLLLGMWLIAQVLPWQPLP